MPGISIGHPGIKKVGRRMKERKKGLTCRPYMPVQEKYVQMPFHSVGEIIS